MTPAPTCVPLHLRLESAILPTTGMLVIKAGIIVEGTAYRVVPFLPYIMVDVGGWPYCNPEREHARWQASRRGLSVHKLKLEAAWYDY